MKARGCVMCGHVGCGWRALREGKWVLVCSRCVDFLRDIGAARESRHV